MPSFQARTLTIEGYRAFDEAEWRDALIVVVAGGIELEYSRGTRQRFTTGDILWFAGLPLRALRPTGPEPAVLLAISRRQA